VSIPASFGINLSSANYRSGRLNRFRQNEIDFGWGPQCTTFALGRALEKGLYPANSALINAITSKRPAHGGLWDDNAGSSRVTKIPSANSFIVWDPFTGGTKEHGHVAFVESIRSDGALVITEANWRPLGSRFSSRIILPSSLAYSQAKFIPLVSQSHISPSPTPSPVNPTWSPRSVLFNPVADISNVNGTRRQSEVIFRPGNGNVHAFLANTNGVAFKFHHIGWAGNEHKLLGSGNIFGSIDSNDELIFRTPQSEIYAFKLNSEGVATQWYRVGGVGSSQQVVGIGDITGNGRDEIIFRDRENISAFHMNNEGIATVFKHVGRAGMDRHIVGIGDITGNGRDEIIFGGSDGNIGAFSIDSGGVASRYFGVGWADPSMQVVGPADLNGDGRDEIIFRSTNGDVGAFRMNSSGVAANYYRVGWADPVHNIIGFGNINTNSPGEEILFRHSNGELNAFFMNTSGVATSWNRLGWADAGIPTM
jgi:surface antigen